MTSLQKCQILDLSPPYVTISHFLIIPPTICHQANSDKLFSWSKTLKNNFTYLVQLICNWLKLNRSTNEQATCLKIYKPVSSLLSNEDLSTKKIQVFINKQHKIYLIWYNNRWNDDVWTQANAWKDTSTGMLTKAQLLPC